MKLNDFRFLIVLDLLMQQSYSKATRYRALNLSPFCRHYEPHYTVSFACRGSFIGTIFRVNDSGIKSENLGQTMTVKSRCLTRYDVVVPLLHVVI